MSLITEVEGDLFLAPEGDALIHACNCQGAWGKGIALDFKKKYPAAYRIYRSYCLKYLAKPQTGEYPSDKKLGNSDEELKQYILRLPEGTALIIPPQKRDYDPQSFPIKAIRGRGRGLGRGREGEGKTTSRQPAGKRHWIICLFTSWHYASGQRTSASGILQNTVSSIADLKSQMEYGAANPDSEKAGLKEAKLWSSRINSGLFGVSWDDTKQVLELSGLDITVVSPPEKQ